MRVDVSCRKCGQRRRLDVGEPPDGRSLEEFMHVLRERLSHQPSFECFGGHMELAPPVPTFWEVHWETVGA